jgi:hypothetical protein
MQAPGMCLRLSLAVGIQLEVVGSRLWDDICREGRRVQARRKARVGGSLGLGEVMGAELAQVRILI